MWLAFQFCPGWCSTWHGVGASSARYGLPARRVTDVGRPRASTGSPSTRRRDRTCCGSIPSMLSKEWFSIMSTTMCSIWGVVGVPSGRFGNGSAPGPSCAAARATGPAHAGRRPAPAARPSTAPPPTLSSVRRESGTATAAILLARRERRGKLEQRGLVATAAGELNAEGQAFAHPGRDADHRPGGLAEREDRRQQRAALAALVAV